MRDFTSGRSLYFMPWSTKLVTAWFLALTLGGCILTGILAGESSGFRPADTSAYYRGDEAGETYPKTTRELVETAHFHVFSMPIVFLVVGHLMGMTRFGNASKSVLISGGFLGVLLNIAAPFLILHAGSAWALGKLAGNILMAVSLVSMSALALWDLLVAPRRGAAQTMP